MITTVLNRPYQAYKVHAWREFWRLWLASTLKFYDPAEVVLITDDMESFGNLWPQTIKALPLPHPFKPWYDEQQLVYSDWYKAQGYRRTGRPTWVVDLDCHIKRRLPEQAESVCRVGVHNPGTAPESDVVHGITYNRVNCAVQYQGRDELDLYSKCLGEALSDGEVRHTWTIGEVASGMCFDRMVGPKELLTQHYSWFAGSGEPPQGVYAIHYGCDTKELLLEKR